MEIKINSESCIRCGKCVTICPSEIFTQEKARTPVGIEDKHCIACGHCVAVCPTASITHPDYPTDHIHPADRATLPTPEQFMQLCHIRRSNRAFSNKPIPEEHLRKILEAAHRAPTATNLQEVEYVLITDPEKLRLIRKYTVETFDSLIRMLKFPLIKLLLKPFRSELYQLVIPSLERLVRAHNAGKDLILRNATAVILIHTPTKCRFGSQDSNLAYQNASLMAETLGVCQFYTGFVCAAIQQDKHNKLPRLLGLKDRYIHAGMALAMPRFQYPNYIDRKEIKVTRL